MSAEEAEDKEGSGKVLLERDKNLDRNTHIKQAQDHLKKYTEEVEKLLKINPEKNVH